MAYASCRQQHRGLADVRATTVLHPAESRRSAGKSAQREVSKATLGVQIVSRTGNKRDCHKVCTVDGDCPPTVVLR